MTLTLCLSKMYHSHVLCLFLVFPTHILCSVKKALPFPFELTISCYHCLKHRCILSAISKNLYLNLRLVRRLAVSSCVCFGFSLFWLSVEVVKDMLFVCNITF